MPSFHQPHSAGQEKRGQSNGQRGIVSDPKSEGLQHWDMLRKNLHKAAQGKLIKTCICVVVTWVFVRK